MLICVLITPMTKSQRSIIQRIMSATEEELFENLPQLESDIIEKTENLRRLIKGQDSNILECISLRKSPANGCLTYPKFDKRVCYYQEFWKVFLINELIFRQHKDFLSLNKTLTIEVNEVEELQGEWTCIQTFRNKKKARRTADKIDKKYVCPFEKCGKNYGSNVSLNLHLKLKHSSGTKTQRQILAKQICMAEERGELGRVEMYLTFPPNYLWHYRAHIYKSSRY